jgi:glutamate dehydrogenase/leucine dehydrogenase
MSALHGCYVTAEDVGTNVNDMDAIFLKTRHTTCISPVLGGSGNPSIPTARGVVKGLEAAFEFVGRSLKGATISVQGCGHVGLPLIHFLFDHGVSKVIASDVDQHDSIIQEFKGRNFHLNIVEKSDCSILFLDVDAVCPCATGGVLNEETIPQITTKIICGAANNQLRDIKRDDQLLHKLGVLYIPDFLVNRMGIVNCADEHMGIIEDDPKLDLHLGREWNNSIFNLTTRVLQESKMKDKTTQEIALELAEERSLELNPCYGHRSFQVIQWLLKSKEWNSRL